MLKSRLPQITAALAGKVDIAVRAGAERIAADAKTRVPVNSGKLRDAIHVERDAPGRYAVIAGDNTAFYGHLVEFGTSKTAAHPFLIPAAEAQRQVSVTSAAQALRHL